MVTVSTDSRMRASWQGDSSPSAVLTLTQTEFFRGFVAWLNNPQRHHIFPILPLRAASHRDRLVGLLLRCQLLSQVPPRGHAPPFQPDDKHMTPPSTAAPLLDCLVPLLPLRDPTSTVSDGLLLSRDVALAGSSGQITAHEAAALWNQMLSRAVVCLRQDNRLEAAHWLQQAHLKKNDYESTNDRKIGILSTDWVTLASCSLVLGEFDSAAAFAVRAWDSVGQSWQEDLLRDCSDVRADTTTLLAMIRTCQQRPDRAVVLIQQAISGHRQVGAVEQLAADFMILSISCELCGNAPKAAEARVNARQIVETSLDPSRHARESSLSRWLTRFGHARPSLLTSREIV